MPEPENKRQTQTEVDSQFSGRWSRALSDKKLTKGQIDSLIEAARWASSAFNEQPWLFLYAVDDESLDLFRSLFMVQNRSWCDTVPMFILTLTKHKFDHNGTENVWAAFDTSSAWMSMALQARSMGLYTHAMAGIHADKAYEVLGVPVDDYMVACGIAVGHYGDVNQLPEKIRDREVPNDRNPLSKVARQVGFTAL